MVWSALHQPSRILIDIETRVVNREDQSTAEREETGDFPEGPRRIANVHEGHVGDDSIERAILELRKMSRVPVDELRPGQPRSFSTAGDSYGRE